MRLVGILRSRFAAASAALTPLSVSCPIGPSRALYPKHGHRPTELLPQSSLLSAAMASSPSAPIQPPPAPPPAPMRGSFIDRRPTWASFNENHAVKSFRRRIVASADISMRPPQFLCLSNEADSKVPKAMVPGASVGYGEQMEEVSARWARKFYGQVTFGPRNFAYPSSRWLARRFQMKKHKIIKRFRFRRYKLAAVANLPFAKMIRVGMLPELKSSKTKKGDAVDAGLSAQLVSAVRSSGRKDKGVRRRPKSKYQV